MFVWSIKVYLTLLETIVDVVVVDAVVVVVVVALFVVVDHIIFICHQ